MNDCDQEDFQVIFNSLKAMRRNLLDDFLNEEPSIYLSCFKYREDDQLMLLSIEKYFISWLNSYWDLLKKHNPSFDKNIYDYSFIYIEVFLLLLESWSLTHSNNNSSPLLLEILEIKIASLTEMLKIGDKSKKNYNKLQLQYEKDKMLFEKELQKLRG
jgi:hypothetical protein